ncbi:MAG: TIM barrel protein [Planctomycetes bacterium]|nr:TIM barrel protein [Planctomycetota bacterium]MCH8211514.1 TIM barrel protein [Planctomycetota bacterium]MCH8258727.1 TIM barrel protein [Planctomycetota bacterium]
MLQGGKLDALDFAAFAKNEFGIEAIEYVNSFFKQYAQDKAYLDQLNRRAQTNGVKSLLIMVDGEGALGDPDDLKREQAIFNHHKWVNAARFLGCHSIRVNAQSSGSDDEQRDLAADGLRRLTEFAAQEDLNVIVENHGGLSSNGGWLSSVIKQVDHPRCGTLPDFGNFCLDWNRRDEPDAWYDRYQGVTELMPFAKAVSAKSHDFDESGNETKTDFRRMMKIVLDANYHGYVGIEYEGSRLSEVEGVKATKKLLETVREELAVPANSSE